MREMLTPEASETHWLAERRLAATVVILALIAIAGAAFLPGLVPGPDVMGLPFSYFLAALGVPAALVVLVGLFLARQAAVDEAYDAAEE